MQSRFITKKNNTPFQPKRVFRGGFTLIEMIVSVAVFMMVVVVVAGAMLSITSANRKSQSTKVAMDNLSFALENMSRHIRVGTDYSCGESLSNTNCSANGESAFSFKYKDPAQPSLPAYQITYKRQVNSGEGQLMVQENGRGAFDSFTSPDVTIESLKFYVSGSGTNGGDADLQPHVIIVIKGYAGGGNVKEKTEFNLQTSVTQRALDL